MTDELVKLERDTPPPVVSRPPAERAERGGDPSDATVAIAIADQPWAGAHAIDTDRPGEVVLADAFAAVGAP